jgi:hypothetical protein
MAHCSLSNDLNGFVNCADFEGRFELNFQNLLNEAKLADYVVCS